MHVDQKANWLEILRHEVNKSSIRQVGDQLKYSRTTISLVLAGKYSGSSGAVAAKVIAVFKGCVLCPHLDTEISPVECDQFSSAPMPMSDPAKLKHWMACRSDCPNSPHSIDDEVDHA